MFEQPADLLTLNYFLEQNLANLSRSNLINNPTVLINGKSTGGRQPIIYNSNSLKNASEYQQQLRPITTENQQILQSRNELEMKAKQPKAIIGF